MTEIYFTKGRLYVPQTAASRSRDPSNPNRMGPCKSNGMVMTQRIEVGGDIANAITSVSKDSLILEWYE